MDGERRGLLVSRGWVRRRSSLSCSASSCSGCWPTDLPGQAPIPERAVDPSGEVVYTERDVERGQEVFLNNGLMEYGSVYGHGAYLGPDYTADYLRRSAEYVRRQARRRAPPTPRRARRSRSSAPTATTSARASSSSTREQAQAHRRLVGHYSRFFSEPTTKHGRGPTRSPTATTCAP